MIEMSPGFFSRREDADNMGHDGASTTVGGGASGTSSNEAVFDLKRGKNRSSEIEKIIDEMSRDTEATVRLSTADGSTNDDDDDLLSLMCDEQ